MGFLGERLRLISLWTVERLRQGMPEVVGPVDREVLFILDGVGGFQFAPLLVRRLVREQSWPLGTIAYDWQFGLMGEVWTDLMWLRRNRVMGARLARKLLQFRRDHPETPIHLLAMSGGAGIAVFALETLGGRVAVETLILAAPALSRGYNLGPALASVKRCYTLVSERDRVILGLGTTVFGTTDRRHGPSAGYAGFAWPAALSAVDREAYSRLETIRWDRSLQLLGHGGGHSGWMQMGFLQCHLLSLLRHAPTLPAMRMPTEPNMLPVTN